MKSNLAYANEMMSEEQIIGSLVSNQACLCVSEDCPIETLMAMMSHMGVRQAAVVCKGGIYKGIVSRSSLLDNLTSYGDIDADIVSHSLQAGDVMISAQAFLPSELDLQDALNIMTRAGYKTMPVLGDNAKFMGIADAKVLAKVLQGPQETFMAFVSGKSARVSMTTRH